MADLWMSDFFQFAGFFISQTVKILNSLAFNIFSFFEDKSPPKKRRSINQASINHISYISI
jgi:hypothetical protein